MNSKLVLGSLITLDDDDRTWLVVHIDEANNEIVLAKGIVEKEIAFSTSDRVVTYSDSNVVNECAEFEETLSANVRNNLIPKTVHGVTANVWIPQVNWISTLQPNSAAGTNNEWIQFDYFTDDLSRIVRDASGEHANWWTASARSSGAVYGVISSGSVLSYNATSQYGFRPFICLPLS